MEQGKFRWRLGHILEAAERIVDRLSSISKEDFLSNYDLQCVIIRQFEIIGEAIGVMGENIYTQYPEVDWHKAKGMRNIFIHEYFEVNLDVVWTTAKKHIPVLKLQIEKILKEL